MIKRTIYFSNPARLSIKLDQLLVQNKETGEERQVPVEDIGFVILDHPQLTYTHAVLQKLSANNCSVMVCDDKHLPAALIHPFQGNTIQNQVYRNQLEASMPLQKQLWQQTIKAKITNQALLLERLGKDGTSLKRFATQVKSGDTTNMEARAAKVYWYRLFELDSFRRERFGPAPNDQLNYGYAVLRAAVARALAGSGLLPALGIHHHNKYNAFCLADDIMEPYRPFVDNIVYGLWEAGDIDTYLSQENKMRLLEVLTCDIAINKMTSPLMVGLSQTTSSLVQCFTGQRKTVKYPKIPSAYAA
ncbi:MAG: type II CRISPR-associated endonuclease Cas1 [Bacteroidia bacterium]